MRQIRSTTVVGITGTPAIDLSSGTLFVDTKLAAGPAQKLHALDIATGGEKFGGPVTVSATSFSASVQHQRPGLLLLKGVVYVSFGSHCDAGSYHGFVLGYNATNLTRVAAFNVTATGSQGAVWSGGMAGTSANLGVWGLTNFLYVQAAPPNAVLNWAAGTLQQSTHLSGPWATTPAASPYLVSPTNTQTFYRLKLR